MSENYVNAVLHVPAVTAQGEQKNVTVTQLGAGLPNMQTTVPVSELPDGSLVSKPVEELPQPMTAETPVTKQKSTSRRRNKAKPRPTETNCEVCGKKVQVAPMGPVNKFCGKTCRDKSYSLGYKQAKGSVAKKEKALSDSPAAKRKRAQRAKNKRVRPKVSETKTRLSLDLEKNFYTKVKEAAEDRHINLTAFCTLALEAFLDDLIPVEELPLTRTQANKQKEVN